EALFLPRRRVGDPDLEAVMVTVRHDVERRAWKMRQALDRRRLRQADGAERASQHQPQRQPDRQEVQGTRMTLHERMTSSLMGYRSWRARQNRTSSPECAG